MSTFYYNYFNPCTPFPRERQRGRETRETEREKKTDREVMFLLLNTSVCISCK